MSNSSNSYWPKIKFVLIVIAVLLVIVLGMAGYMEISGADFHFFGALYAVINLFMMGDADPVPGSLLVLIAQYLAAILFGLGVFSLVFDKVHNAWVILKIRFGYKDHIVIFSLNTIGQKICAELLLQKGVKVVIVEADQENSAISHVQDHGALVIYGQGTDPKVIANAGIEKAKTCIICGDSDQENMEIAKEVLFQRDEQKEDESLKILLHITENNNINVLKDYLDIHNQDEDYDLETFNVWQLAGKKIYDLYPPHEHFDYHKDEENAIAIYGYTQATEEFILENVILSHYPEHQRLKIYLLDKDAELHTADFNYKYPFISDFIELKPVKLLNASFYANFTWSKKEIEMLSKVRIVYMFGESDAALLTTSASLRQFFYNQTQSISQVPIILCLPEDAGITELLDANRDLKTNASQVFSNKLNIKSFKLISDTCTSRILLEHTELIDKLSKVINYYYSMKYEFSYELQDHWKIADGDALIADLEKEFLSLSELPGKLSDKVIQKHLIKHLSEKTGVHYNSLYSKLSIEKRWNMLTHRKKDSNRYAARQLGLKFHELKRIGCDPLTTENIVKYYAKLAPMEHTRWSAEKMVFNYKYGPLVSDKAQKFVLKDILKIHDQLIPFEDLSEHEKEKDLNLFLLLPVLSHIYHNN